MPLQKVEEVNGVDDQKQITWLKRLICAIDSAQRTGKTRRTSRREDANGGSLDGRGYKDSTRW